MVGPPPGPMVQDQEPGVLMHRSGRASRLRARPRSRCETRSSTSPEIGLRVASEQKFTLPIYTIEFIDGRRKVFRARTGGSIGFQERLIK
jgi:hypothetical protein